MLTYFLNNSDSLDKCTAVLQIRSISHTAGVRQRFSPHAFTESKKKLLDFVFSHQSADSFLSSES